MKNVIRGLLMLGMAAPLAAQSAQMQGAATAPAAPAVGEMAPDFTLPWADGKGTKAEPLTLSKLRGQVVVLAFYPADFSSGCTIEMSKFRDEYKTIFGDGAIVVPISHDSLAMHTKWVNDKQFPFALASDPAGDVARLYASAGNGRPYFSRTVFVIGKDGKIVWESTRFNANAQVGYDDLTNAIAAAKK